MNEIQSKQVLIMDADEGLVHELRHALAELGCTLVHAPEAEPPSARFNLVICDSTLAAGRVCELVRSLKQISTFLLLTAPPASEEEIVALELGADDYLIKPYSVRELLARVRALFRRAELEAKAAEERRTSDRKQLQFGCLAINLATRQVHCGGKPVNLTNTEYLILTVLASAPGRPISREQLVELVWGYPSTEHSHAMMTHVSRLRAKLAEQHHDGPYLIETIRGLGYRFNA